MENSFDLLNYVSINDIIFIAIFLIFVIYKASIGLMKSLMPLIALVLSLALAWSLAGALAPTITDRLYVRFESKIEENIDLEKLEVNATEEIVQNFVNQLPESLGSFFQNFVGEEKMTEFTEQLMNNLGAEQTVKDKAMDATKTIFYNVFSGIIKICVFIIAWLILDIIFKFIGALIAKTFELPGLSLINCLGGAVVGAGEFYLIFWVLKTACVSFGVDWMTRFAEGSNIISKFM